jgi:hypothetical protein
VLAARHGFNIGAIESLISWSRGQYRAGSFWTLARTRPTGDGLNHGTGQASKYKDYFNKSYETIDIYNFNLGISAGTRADRRRVLRRG